MRLSGNRVSNLFTSLRTDLADPVERLNAIHDVTGAAKEVQNLLGIDMLADWVEYAPPRPYSWVMRLYSRLGLAERHRPPINLVVSNVPGPRDPLYIAGARLVGHLVGRPDPRGHRPQRHRVELPVGAPRRRASGAVSTGTTSTS